LTLLVGRYRKRKLGILPGFFIRGQSMDPKVTELYNDYIHGDMPRCSFLQKSAGITGGGAVAKLGRTWC
jgi:hypothetical protein